MPRHSDQDQPLRLEDLIGLGSSSARKSHYAELETKLAELEAERNRYKWLFENALHGIFQAELDGPLRTANPALAGICGYFDSRQLLEQLPDLASLFADRSSYLRLRQQLLSQGRLYRFETQLLRPDGEHIYVSLNALLKQEGDTPLVEAFVQDISERVRAQQAQEQLNEELEARVRSRTQELTRLNQQLHQAKVEAEQANLSKDKYLAAASHDLLQPLNAARLLVAALGERALPEAEAELVEHVQLALDGAEELLADLLEISKLDQNAVQPQWEECDLHTLLCGLEQEFQPLARQEGLALKVRPRQGQLRSDPHLLRRILRNFISNALRYTQHGRILISARRRGAYWQLQVWDTGAGIPNHQLSEIFQEFRQLPQHQRNAKSKGVGLGLAIVERMARVLGHPVEVRSRQGRGSVFSIRVPLLATTPASPPSPHKSSHQPGQLPAAHILVVDNDEAILLSMATLLGQWGCQVSLATNLEQALHISKRQPPALLLVDYHLDHGQTGLQVLDALRRQQPDLPAVIISADRSDSNRQHWRERQLPVLPKPVKAGKLRAVISHLLSLG